MPWESDSLMLEEMAKTEQFSEQEHFEAVVRRYQGPLLRYVRCSLGQEDAQDVVQEVFLRLHRAMRKHGMRRIECLRAWLFKVAHNCTADVLRKKKRTSKMMETVTDNVAADPVVTPDGLEKVVHREDCRLALALLDKLPANERRVLVLHVQDGMTYREIGRVTNQGLGTVGYLMNQGLGRLAREMKSAGAI